MLLLYLPFCKHIPKSWVGACLFLFLNTGIFVYWAGFPLVNSIVFDGYAQPYNGIFESARYSYVWWFVWLLGLNCFLPILFAFALLNNDIDEISSLHKFFSAIGVLSNMVSLLALLVIWGFFCNTSYSGYNTICNSYAYCCVFFPSDWCPNQIPCTPAVTSGELNFTNEYLQHIVFSSVFFVFSCWNVSINQDMRRFGVFR